MRRHLHSMRPRLNLVAAHPTRTLEAPRLLRAARMRPQQVAPRQPQQVAARQPRQAVPRQLRQAVLRQLRQAVLRQLRQAVLRAPQQVALRRPRLAVRRAPQRAARRLRRPAAQRGAQRGARRAVQPKQLRLPTEIRNRSTAQVKQPASRPRAERKRTSAPTERSARFTLRTVLPSITALMAAAPFRPGARMAAESSALEGAEASRNTTSHVGAAGSQAVPITEAGTLMRAPTEEATGMAATTTTTTRDATGEADFMVTLGAVGLHRSPLVGGGGERPCLGTMGTSSIRTPSTQLQPFGSRTI